MACPAVSTARRNRRSFSFAEPRLCGPLLANVLEQVEHEPDGEDADEKARHLGQRRRHAGHRERLPDRHQEEHDHQKEEPTVAHPVDEIRGQGHAQDAQEKRQQKRRGHHAGRGPPRPRIRVVPAVAHRRGDRPPDAIPGCSP